jgi:hypothetical protein
MQNRHRRPRGACNLEGAVDHRRYEPRYAAAEFGRRAERVREDALQLGDRVAVAVHAQGTSALEGNEPAQLVEPEDVVGVAVGIDHRVDARQLLRQRLAAQVRSGVDEHLGAVIVCHHDRGAEAPVFRGRRLAHAAGAADHRDALRGAGAKERDAHAQGLTMRLEPFRVASTYFMRSS